MLLKSTGKINTLSLDIPPRVVDRRKGKKVHHVYDPWGRREGTKFFLR